MPKTIVISHFYNEEYLLPWWLKHHVPLFDHGILIDYASTDRSVAICKELAPHWEVRPSKNVQFTSKECDLEVMEIENEFSGWKIALNVTEFFCTRDMSDFLWSIKNHGWSAYGIRGLSLVDPLPNIYTYPDPDPDIPLVTQRFHGYFEDNQLSTLDNVTCLSRSRLFHNHANGNYSPGRHFSFSLSPYMHPPGALIVHFLFSPLTEPFLARKLQIQTRIPKEEALNGFGSYHFVNHRRLIEMWHEQAQHVIDLRTCPDYLKILGAWSATMQLPRTPPKHFPISGYIYPERKACSGYDIAIYCLQNAFYNDTSNYFSKLCHDTCTNLLARNSEDTKILNLFGVLKCCLKDYDAAHQLFSNAIQYQPAFDEARINLAKVLTIQGKAAEAEAIFQDVLSRHPEWMSVPTEQLIL